MTKAIDLLGRRFGKLLVVARAESDLFGQARWLCSCDCGGQSIVVSASLRRGVTCSCGCMERLSHGHARKGRYSPTYNTWAAMINRCTNPEYSHYEYYGGRGIKVISSWMYFENFLADMGERPEGKTLDRYPNNDGDYEPGNCRWATKKEQANNCRPRKKRAAN